MPTTKNESGIGEKTMKIDRNQVMIFIYAACLAIGCGTVMFGDSSSEIVKWISIIGLGMGIGGIASILIRTILNENNTNKKVKKGVE